MQQSFDECLHLFTQTAPWVTYPAPTTTAPSHSQSSSTRTSSRRRRGEQQAQDRARRAENARRQQERAEAVSAFFVELMQGTEGGDGAADLTFLCVFIVYYSAFLTFWSHQQQQQQQQQGSRHESDRKSPNATARAASFDDVMRYVYGAPSRVPARGEGTRRSSRNEKTRGFARAPNARSSGEDKDGTFVVQAAVQACLACLPAPDEILWRHPALLASFRTLAAEVDWLARVNHGGPSQRLHDDDDDDDDDDSRVEQSGCAVQSVLPCPLCMAAAVDDVLVAEAVWSLLRLHATLESGAEPTKRREGHSKRKMRDTGTKAREHRADRESRRGGRESLVFDHVLAVCRLGVLNGSVCVACRALYQWYPRDHTWWSSFMQTDEGVTDGKREGGLEDGEERTRFVRSLVNLVLQDEATLRMCASTELEMLQRGEDDILCTLQSLRTLLAETKPLAQARIAVSVTNSVAPAGRRDDCDLFYELMVETPYLWLSAALVCDISETDAGVTATGRDRTTGRTVLTWLCHHGYLNAARFILQPLLSVRDDVTQDTEASRRERVVSDSLSEPLHACLSSPHADWECKAAMVRLLLLAGASAHSVPARVMATIIPSDGSRDALQENPHQRETLELLFSAGTVLDPPLASDSGGGAQLLERIRLAMTATSAADRLAGPAARLWTERVRHLSAFPHAPSSSTTAATAAVAATAASSLTAGGAEGSTGGAAAMAAGRRAQVAAAQDRVLRLAFAALAYDPHHVPARLVVASVLGRRLRDEASADREHDADSTRMWRATRRLYELVTGGLLNDEGVVKSTVRARLALTECLASREEARHPSPHLQGEHEEAAPGAAHAETKEGAVGRKSKAEVQREELHLLLSDLRGDYEAIAQLPHPSVRAALPDTAAVYDGPHLASSEASLTRYARVVVPGAGAVWVRASPWVDLEATLRAAEVDEQSGDAAWESPPRTVTAAVGVVDTPMPPHATLQTGDVVLFQRGSRQPTEATTATAAAAAGEGFVAVRVVRPLCSATTTDALKMRPPHGLVLETCEGGAPVHVRCVLSAEASAHVPLDTGVAQDASESGSSSFGEDTDADSMQSHGKRPHQPHQHPRTLCLRYLCTSNRVASLSSRAAATTATAGVGPLQWLEARTGPSGQGVVAALTQQPALAQALFTQLAIAKGIGEGGVGCWVVDLGPCASQQQREDGRKPHDSSADASDEEASRTGALEAAIYLSPHPTCIWQTPMWERDEGSVRRPVRAFRLGFPVLQPVTASGTVELLFEGDDGAKEHRCAGVAPGPAPRALGVFVPGIGF